MLSLPIVIFLLRPAPIDPSVDTPPWPPELTGALIVALDEEGSIIPSLHAPSGKHLQAITSAQENGGLLYSGSPMNDRIGKYEPPDKIESIGEKSCPAD